MGARVMAIVEPDRRSAPTRTATPTPGPTRPAHLRRREARPAGRPQAGLGPRQRVPRQPQHRPRRRPVDRGGARCERKQGWRAFLAADGLDDWVVLHGGTDRRLRRRLDGGRRPARRCDRRGARRGRVAGRARPERSRPDRPADARDVGPGGTPYRHRARDLDRRSGPRRGLRSSRDTGGAGRESRRNPTTSTCPSGAPCSATTGWRTTMGSIRSATAPRSGCRTSTRPNPCGTPCTSTSRSPASTPRPGSTSRWPPAGGSSTSPDAARLLDPVRPSGEQGLHRRLAGWRGGGRERVGRARDRPGVTLAVFDSGS